MDNKTNYYPALVRLVSLLLTIAGIAGRAAFLPTPARRALLFLLRPFERRARRLAIDLATDLGWQAVLPAPHFSHRCDQHADAVRMAHSLEAIAGLIDQLLHRGVCCVGASRRWSLMACLLTLAVPQCGENPDAISVCAWPAPDTS